jgi:ABC-2 type transport system ATP-binding protein
MQEVEAICDRVIIIDNGVIVADEDKAGIYSKIKNKVQSVNIEFDKTVTGNDLLKIKNVSRVRNLKNNAWLIESDGDEDIRPDIFSFAVTNNLTVLSLQKHENNLEDIFRRLTRG